MRIFHNALGHLTQHRRRHRCKIRFLRRPEYLIADLNNLIKKKVVKDSVTAQDEDVTLIGRNTMDGATFLNDFQGYGLIKILIDAPIDAGEL